MIGIFLVFYPFVQKIYHAEILICVEELKMEKMLWDVKTASEYLGIATSTIYTLCAQRKLPYIKVGGRKLFTQQLLDEFIESSIVK